MSILSFLQGKVPSLSPQCDVDQYSLDIKQWITSREFQSQDPIKRMGALSIVITTSLFNQEGFEDKVSEEAKRTYVVARYYFDNRPYCRGWSEQLGLAIYSNAINLMDNLVSIFGINALTRIAESWREEDSKVKKMTNLIAVIPAIGGNLLPYVGVKDAKDGVALALVSLIGISVIYPRLRPAPIYLPGGVNWTLELDRMDIYNGSDVLIEEIASALSRNLPVLLTGRSGVGKTETVKMLTQRIAEGHYEELKGKTVFYFNTSDLCTGEENLLKLIQSRVDNCAGEIIFVFDEMHIACRSKMAEQFKTLFDPGPHGFPYVIGITTEKEYKDFFVEEQPALLRRFKVVNKKPPTDPELLKILQDILLRNMPEALVEKELFPHLLQEASSQLKERLPHRVHNSVDLLYNCMKRVGPEQFAKVDKKAIASRDSLQQWSAEQLFKDPSVQTFTEPPLIAKEKSKHAADLTLFKQRKELFKIKEQIYSLVVYEVENQLTSTQLTLYHLLASELYPKWKAQLLSKAQSAGVQLEITKKLVNEEIAKMLEQERTLP